MHVRENRALCQPQDLAWRKARNQNWREAQTCTRGKQRNNAKTHAWALRLRGNMQVEGGQMGAQRSRVPQRKGTWVWRHSDMNSHTARRTAIPGPSALNGKSTYAMSTLPAPTIGP